MVRPLLEYGNAIWGPHYLSDVRNVESIQKRATKLIPKLRNMTYKDHIMVLKLPSLKYRRRRGDMILMFKIMHGLVRVAVNDLFIPIESSRTRGHAKRVYKTPAIKHSRVFSFSRRVINDWNSLPEDVIESPTLNAFKNRLDEYWKQYMYEIVE